MKYLLSIIILLVAVFFVYFMVFTGRGEIAKNEEQSQEQTSEAKQKQWETKSDEQVPVAITITPIEFGRDAKQWRFIVVFDTHSGSLDDDPMKTVSMVDDKGNTYSPIIWEGPGPGGHHREGTLIFNPVDPLPKYVQLKIKDVGGIAERTFTWDFE